MVNVTSNPPVLSVKANLRPEAGGAAGLVVAFDPVSSTRLSGFQPGRMLRDVRAWRNGSGELAGARKRAAGINRPGN